MRLRRSAVRAFLAAVSLALLVPLGACIPAGGVACEVDSDCPVSTSACAEPVCHAGFCGATPKADGTPVADRTRGDCRAFVCDGKGGLREVADDADLPDDDDPCTEDLCEAGAPVHRPAAAGSACGDGLQCDGRGFCVGCTQPIQCPGSDDECRTRTCVDAVCGHDFAPAGKVLNAQTAGDCAELRCNGTGRAVKAIDDKDLPADDGSDCTEEVCDAGIPKHRPLPAGSECETNGGAVCSAQGQCIATCSDGVKNGGETGVDCGGPCPECAECGNGRVERGEECDDGGKAGGDGCSASCQIESGWACRVQAPSSCSVAHSGGDFVLMLDFLYHSASGVDPSAETVPQVGVPFLQPGPNGTVFVHLLSDWGDPRGAELRWRADTRSGRVSFEPRWDVTAPFRGRPARRYMVWRAAIPAQASGTTVGYRIFVHDDSLWDPMLMAAGGQMANSLGQQLGPDGAGTDYGYTVR